MPNLALVIFVSFELCYYLLVAQTGIVELFNSDLFQIGYLPVGGVIGSYLSTVIKTNQQYKVYGLLSLQFLMTLFYPNLQPIHLFLLGIAVGGLAPLVINSLKNASNLDLILALSLSYTAGTLLFNTDPAGRTMLALGLTSVAMFAFFLFSAKGKNQKMSESLSNYPLWLMVLWVFLDSTLFETLSRDIMIPIWRGGFTWEIALFHILGVVAAFTIKLDQDERPILILVLFAFSYLLYFIREPLLLSIVYPFVISFYNVEILQTLRREKSLKRLGIYMIFIGWAASGLGLMVALEEIVIYMPLVLMATFFIMVAQQLRIISKEASHG